MSSDAFACLSRLIDKTESNIRLIEDTEQSFIYPTLNEWRYATRHVIAVLNNPQNTEELQRAERHLKRAYFDSCGTLLLFYIDKIEKLDRSFKGYSSQVAQFVDSFAEGRKAVVEARAFYAKIRQRTDEEKESDYGILVEKCALVRAFVQELESTKDDWMEAIRKQKTKDRLSIVATIAAILAVGVSIVALICH